MDCWESLSLSAVIMAERTLLYGMFPAIFLILLHQVYRHYIRNKRIYEYHYSQLFPFKVFRSPNKLYDQSKAIFIHGKIYIIDDRIVYTGSLNFTIGGTSSNYETRVRTEDPAAVRKIVDEFYALFNSPYDKGIFNLGEGCYTRNLSIKILSARLPHFCPFF